MLSSGNVTAAVTGTAITLTANDANDHNVSVYRLDATHVEVDGTATLINGSASAVFSLTSVAGITVNLGSGHDTYHIFSTGATALNIGAQGVTFRGANGATTGDDLEVFNDSAVAMTVGGDVAVYGPLIGSPLAAGAGSSYFGVYTHGSGNLTINGSIVANETNSSSGTHEVILRTAGAGNLAVSGAISITNSATAAAGVSNNFIETNDSGSISVGQSISIVDSGPQEQHNYINTNFSGGIHVAGSISIDSAPTTGASTFNDVYTFNSGSIQVQGAISLRNHGTTASGHSDNFVFTNNTGSISVGQNISITDAGPQEQHNYINTNGSGTILVAGSILIDSAPTGSASTFNDVYTFNSGNIQVQGAISLSNHGTATSGHSDNFVFTDNSGSISVGQNVSIADSGPQEQHNYVNTNGSGTLSIAGLVLFTGFGTGTHFNDLYTFGGGGSISVGLGMIDTELGTGETTTGIFTQGIGGITVGPLGVSITDFGPGNHSNRIYAATSGDPIWIKGAVNVTDFGTGHSDFEIYTNSANSPITIAGFVNYDNAANWSGRSYVTIYGSTDDVNSLVTIQGFLSLNLAKTSGTANDGLGYSYNYVWIGEDTGDSGAGYGTVISGPAMVIGGDGQDKVYLAEARLLSLVSISLLSDPQSSLHDLLEIDGSRFGGTFTATVWGPAAEIDINNGQGHQTAQFDGLFLAIMAGSHNVMNIANGAGTGFSNVNFAAGLIVVGTYGAGSELRYKASNVTWPFLIPPFVSVIAT